MWLEIQTLSLLGRGMAEAVRGALFDAPSASSERKRASEAALEIARERVRERESDRETETETEKARRKQEREVQCWSKTETDPQTSQL